MDGMILRLSPYDRIEDAQELPLRQRRMETSILDTVSQDPALVFYDYEYSAQLEGIDTHSIQSLQLTLNGNELNYSFDPRNGELLFGHDEYDRKIFSECFGFVQFQITYIDEQKTVVRLETEPIQVMVKKNGRNDSVRRMVDFIYRKDPGLLFEDRKSSAENGNAYEAGRKTLENSIHLLRDISNFFEENFRYFKANSRFITIPQERVDTFERLQCVTNRTLQHIVQHPEELYRVNSNKGIRIGEGYYQPGKTLTISNVKSFDIYENQVLIAFLATLLHALDSIDSEIQNVLTHVPQRPYEKQEYITSTYFIYANTVATLKQLREEVGELRRKYYNIQSAYAKILPVRNIILAGIPQYTQIFRSVPQYHKAYSWMASWFSKGALSLKTEKYMLSFLKTSTLYEMYVLAKILNYFRDEGYELTELRKITYPFSGVVKYTNTNSNNYFCYLKGDSRVEVYYQPVIYGEDKRDITGIGLYRNTTISFSTGEDDASRTGRYYSPDYLIKYSVTGQAGCRYLIADAKFSNLDRVKSREVPKLAYKYLFSMACFEAEDRIVELCIFNGLSAFDRDGVTNIYDANKGWNPIVPAAEIITLTENEIENESFHKELLQGTLGKFRVAKAISAELPTPANIENNNVPNLTTETDDVSAMEVPVEQSNAEIIKDVAEEIATEAETPKDKKKKNKQEKPKLIDMPLSNFAFEKELLDYFEAHGYSIARDIVPNCSKKDLETLTDFNRQARRHIEGVLKQKGLRLTGK